MVGGTIMTHGDDRGLRLPPAVAPVQVAIVPIYKTDEERSAVMAIATKMRAELTGQHNLRVKLDDRDQHRPGFKFSEWELKGVPLRVEVGPRDVANDQVVVAERMEGNKKQLSTGEASSSMAGLLNDIQRALYEDAKAFLEANTHEISTFEDFAEGVENEGGFWVGAWCGDGECEVTITERTKATIRFVPIEREDPGAACVHCGKPGTERATWAKAY
jgi:prolyl-tRNA synthetase